MTISSKQTCYVTKEIQLISSINCTSY